MITSQWKWILKILTSLAWVHSPSPWTWSQHWWHDPARSKSLCSHQCELGDTSLLQPEAPMPWNNTFTPLTPVIFVMQLERTNAVEYIKDMKSLYPDAVCLYPIFMSWLIFVKQLFNFKGQFLDDEQYCADWWSAGSVITPACVNMSTVTEQSEKCQQVTSL